MPKNPSRIDLLELDIDLRLADLWREAYEIGEWKLDVVAAFIRAAYGKGYCDALTEERPGSLCQEHGYRVPARRQQLGRSLELARRQLTRLQLRRFRSALVVLLPFVAGAGLCPAQASPGRPSGREEGAHGGNMVSPV